MASKNGLAGDFLMLFPLRFGKLNLWIFLVFISLISEIKADVRSTNGTINFDSNSDGLSEARLTSEGLAIGPNLSPSTNLLVLGNALISNDLTVGGGSGSSNLSINGSIGFSVQALSANATLGNYSVILVDTSNSNVLLTLPYAGNMSGREFTIKKLSTSNKLSIWGGGNFIDNQSVLELTNASNNFSSVSLVSDGRQWCICERSAGVASSWAWTPAQISTQSWYDASDTSTITSSFIGNVTQWNDKGGGGYHLTQTTSSKQPITGASINGLNAVNFTNSTMSTSSNPFGANISNGFVICVHKMDSASYSDPTLFSLTGSDITANRWQVHAPYGDGNAYFDCGGGAGSSRISAAYNNLAGNIILASFYCSTTDGVQEIYKNGYRISNDTSGHTVTTVGNIIIGSSNVSNYYQDTTIGELIIINGTVNSATREKLEGYLAWKWGLHSYLPASHPYKSAPISY